MPPKNIKNCVLTRESEKNLISRRDPQQENIIIIVVMMDNNYYFSVVIVVVVVGAAAAAALGVTIIVFSFGKNLLLKSDTSKFHHVYDC